MRDTIRTEPPSAVPQRVPPIKRLVLAGLELKAATRGLCPAERDAHCRLLTELEAIRVAMDNI